jgi:hypothetical protein
MSSLGFSFLFRLALPSGFLLSPRLASEFFESPPLLFALLFGFLYPCERLLFGLPSREARPSAPKSAMLPPNHWTKHQRPDICTYPNKMVDRKYTKPMETRDVEENESQHDGQPAHPYSAKHQSYC